jgi:hypothetical protein
MSTATVSIQHPTQIQPYRSTGVSSGDYQAYHYSQEQHQYPAQTQPHQPHQHSQQIKREDQEEPGSTGATMTYEINRECLTTGRPLPTAILITEILMSYYRLA